MKNKKRGKSIKINITLSNRWLYTLIVIGILAIIGVEVYASTYVNPTTKTGHDISELQPCSNAQTLVTQNGIWTCASPSSAETDPTVKSWAKDDTQDIATYGNLKIMRKYRYDFSGEYCTFYGSTPRCPPDVSATVDELLEKTFYTNIDSGSVCYDWWKSSSTQQNLGCKYKKISGGPWTVNEVKYQYR